MDDDQGKFDLEQSRAERDKGIALVSGNNPEFKYDFFHAIRALPKGWEGQCEDIRKDWTGVRPTHHNAWGACWNGAVTRGLLMRLPTIVSMTGVKSHGRKTHKYRRT
jgi:hypothetical protein